MKLLEARHFGQKGLAAFPNLFSLMEVSGSLTCERGEYAFSLLRVHGTISRSSLYASSATASFNQAA